MSNRWYFLLGDIVSSLSVGAAAAFLSVLFVNPEWNMFAGTLVGAAGGMMTALLLGPLLFMRYFGAMEVIVPMMLGGMSSGMIIGMRAAMVHYSYPEALAQGAAIGLVVLLFCAYANYLIGGAARDA
jgi:ABC-type tungstate transport system substrate-binding protein